MCEESKRNLKKKNYWLYCIYCRFYFKNVIFSLCVFLPYVLKDKILWKIVAVQILKR